MAEIDPAAGRDRAHDAFPRCSMAGASSSSSRWPSRPICTWCEDRHDPLHARSASSGHAFESWFQNSAAYDKQDKRGLVTCPVCGSAKVEKAIMAPRLSCAEAAATGASRRRRRRRAGRSHRARRRPPPLAMMSPQERELRNKLKELRDHI